MRMILLSQGKVTVVDDCDFDALSRFKWHAFKKGTRWYAARSLKRDCFGKKQHVYLHQEILPGAEEIDHRDGDGLNNRRENLRPATRSQNNANSRKRAGVSSKFKGVCWETRRAKWRAEICFQGVRFSLGHFIREEDAALAYDEKAKILFGEFARLNFPQTS